MSPEGRLKWILGEKVRICERKTAVFTYGDRDSKNTIPIKTEAGNGREKAAIFPSETLVKRGRMKGGKVLKIP